MTVPYAFANLSGNIALAKLDSNFNTPITIGNTSVLLGNTVTTLNNLTLANVTITSGTSNVTNVNVTNVTVTNLTATLANVTTLNVASAYITSANIGTLALTNALPVSSGGTGQVTFPANSVLLGNGTGGIATVAPGNVGNVLTSIGGVWVSNVAVSSAAAGANTQVQYNNSGALAGSANLVFDGANLGLGVTPSAWNTAGSGRAIQFSNSTNLAAARASALASWYGAIGLMNDCYYGTDNNFKYFSGQTPALYTINNGTHLWQYAASGTAGNTIAFTQAMTLDASGNLLVGTTSASGTLSVNGAIANVGANSSLSFSGTSTIINASASAAVAGTHGSSLVFAQSWSSGSPSSTIATGQITGVKIASDGTFGGGLAFWTSNGAGNDLSERMRLNSLGNLGVGTTAPNASAILDVQSTTKGVRMPNMTTTQKNAIASPAAGLMVFDTTLAKLCVYSGSAWQTITSV